MKKQEKKLKRNSSSTKIMDAEKTEEKKTSVLVDEQRPEKKADKPAVKSVSLKGEFKEVKAKAKYLRISPKKMKLVVDVVRGMRVVEALNKLVLINKGSSPMVIKLINSAVANAENNFKLKREDLYIKHIVANQGPTFHRWKPAAFGTAHPIRKRTTHLELSLGIKQESDRTKKLKIKQRNNQDSGQKIELKNQREVKGKTAKKNKQNKKEASII